MVVCVCKFYDCEPIASVAVSICGIQIFMNLWISGDITVDRTHTHTCVNEVFKKNKDKSEDVLIKLIAIKHVPPSQVQ